MFAPFGLRVIYQGKWIGKYPLEELEKYFRLNLTAEDATEQNTLQIHNLVALQNAWLFMSTPAALTTDILTEKFRAELEEYHDSVIGKRKALGVLIRGTDYVVSNMGGDRRMASAERTYSCFTTWKRSYTKRKSTTAG